MRIADDILLLGRIGRAWRRRSIRDFGRLLAYNLGLMLTGKYREISEAYDQSFDRRFNVETAGTEEPAFLTADSRLREHAKAYEPVSEQIMHSLLGMLPPLNPRDFLFVDLGSGKGRALFVAATHPFRQVIGIEYSAELHHVAMRNVHTYRNQDQKCFKIKSILADASSFALPLHPTVCFMNNPYDESLVKVTAEHLDRSLKSAPRPFFLIYANAYYTAPLDALEGWSRLGDGWLGRWQYAIWRWEGVSVERAAPATESHARS
jgi:SAM-dependent methyltransferase